MSKAQLARLIDLPDSDLQQVLDYAASLSKADAVSHFTNLLGDAPAVVDFVAAFNRGRHDIGGPQPSQKQQQQQQQSSSSSSASRAPDADAVPKPTRPPRKKKAPLHTPPPRQIVHTGPPPGAHYAVYNKKDRNDEYILGRSGASTPVGPSRATTPVSGETQPPSQPPKQHPSRSAGSLVQDALAPKSRAKKNASAAHNAAPTPPTTKISFTGGVAMHGASSALADFDAAIRALELSTNPTLPANSSAADALAARRCACVATRHPLQTAAPNCLHCGKVVCVKEGLGPCTACGTPLLAPADVQAMLHELKAERGRERMAADRAAHQRVPGNNSKSATGRPTMVAGTTKWGTDNGDFVTPKEAAAATLTAEAKARAHRDRLLAFQAQNAQRTTVRDEAADFDPGVGAGPPGGLWASPEERARALKRQQKLLREMEWNARPEYEKRQQVLSIDLGGKKVFRRTVVAAERPASPVSEEEGGASEASGDEGLGRQGAGGEGDGERGGGTFSHNPLLGRLIRPVYCRDNKSKGNGGNGAPAAGRQDAAPKLWQRVQDDLDDNEAVILDGGVFGERKGP